MSFRAGAQEDRFKRRGAAATLTDPFPNIKNRRVSPTRHAAAACVLALVGAAEPDAGGGERGSPLDQAAPIVREVQRRLGDDVRILSLEVWPEEALIAVQDPQNSAHVDRYGYRDGSLSSPEPMAVGRNARQVRARLFALRDVNLSVLPSIVSAAPDAVQTEEGRVTHALLERAQGWNTESSWGRPVWRVYVEGPRGGGYVEYRLDGKRGRVVRW